jgi:5-hydroxyisourate hydrolase
MTLSTHVLDTSIGRPAVGVRVRLLQRLPAGDWGDVAEAATNADGRVAAWPASLLAGTYRLTFAVSAYFAARGVETFYTDVTVEFVARDAGHYHVPLLVSPFGYSTYRGS